MLAKKANAEARITIQETLDGLSTEADIRALESVRENIEKLQAEADIGAEIEGESLDDKLVRIREKAADANAQAELDELKKQMAARRAAQAEGPKNL
jgi:phage shock protein A